MNENTAYIGLGSNKGDKAGYLREAVLRIREDKNCSVIAASSVYETKPYGLKDQDNFLNAALEIKTGYSFSELLPVLKRIEAELGRTENRRWGPREIDLDLLLYNDIVYRDEKLTIPHDEIQFRDFVLVPLCEIAPDLIHPALNKKICNINIEESEKCIIGKIQESIL